MPEQPATSHLSRWKRVGFFAAIIWLGVLSYFLLIGDPPDFWFDDIASVETPGHLIAGVVTGLIAYLFLAKRPRPVVTAMGVTIAILLGLELLQDLLSSRGYERSDVALSVVGAAAGVGAGWIVSRLMGSSAKPD